MKPEKLKYYPRESKENFSFDHVHIRPDKQVPLHQQETWELAYIVLGTGIRIIGGIVDNFSEGEIVFITPDIPHCWSFDPKVCDTEGKIENICIFINSEFFQNLKIAFPELQLTISEIQENPNAISFSGKTLENLQQLMKKMTSQTKIERLSTLILILDQVSTSSNLNIIGSRIEEVKNEKNLHQIYLFILNNFHRHIELEEVSKIAGMPKSTFCLFFKKMTGKPFIQYVKDFRIESACQMLVKTKMTVSEICVASGFNDIPYFNRTFKNSKKITPSEYRKLNRI